MDEEDPGFRIEPILPPHEPFMPISAKDPRERQIEALVNALLALGVTRERIAGIMLAAAEPYIAPETSQNGP
jgi:hypothetical protein